MRLLFKKLRSGAVIPKYQTEYSAGLDLCACIDETLTVSDTQQTLTIEPGGYRLYVNF